MFNLNIDAVAAYDLTNDPFELVRLDIDRQYVQKIADDVVTWRSNSIFRIDQKKAGTKTLFGRWFCWWNNRVSQAKLLRKTKD